MNYILFIVGMLVYSLRIQLGLDLGIWLYLEIVEAILL